MRNLKKIFLTIQLVEIKDFISSNIKPISEIELINCENSYIWSNSDELKDLKSSKSYLANNKNIYLKFTLHIEKTFQNCITDKTGNSLVLENKDTNNNTSSDSALKLKISKIIEIPDGLDIDQLTDISLIPIETRRLELTLNIKLFIRETNTMEQQLVYNKFNNNQKILVDLAFTKELINKLTQYANYLKEFCFYEQGFTDAIKDKGEYTNN